MERQANPFLMNLRKQSEILTVQHFSIHSTLIDQKNLEGLLLELSGDSKGQYKRNGEPGTGKIPSLQSQLTEIGIRFEKLNIQRSNQGKEELSSMPVEMQEEKLKIEAALIVAEEEVAVLEKELKKYTDKENEASERAMLQYGLRLQTTIKSGEISSIDGQRVSRSAEGVWFINEGRYEGLSLSDYRIMAERWQRERTHAQQSKLSRLQQEAFEGGFEPPRKLSFRGAKVVDVNSLPPFPVGAVNHKAKVNA